jgi:mannosyltransferase
MAEEGGSSRAWTWVGALTLLGLVLRLPGIEQSFSFDEAYGVGNLLDRSLGDMLAILPQSESSPPLHYVAAWGWGNVFGLSEAGVRSLSVLAGVATVPVAYLAGRELAGPRAGLIAAALVAVSPFLVFYSLEARAYALLTLLGALSFWLFARALRRQRGATLAPWAVVSALALATHYFAGFLILAEAVWLVLAARGSRPVLAAVGGLVLASVALLPLALRQADGRTGWIGETALLTRARQTVTQFSLGEIDPVSNAVLALLLLAGAAGLACTLHGRAREALRTARVPLVVGATALAVPLVLDLLGAHYLIARNAIATLPVLLVGVGALLAPLPARRATALAAAVCAVGLAVSVASWFDPGLQRSDVRAAADSLERSPTPVVVAPYLSSAQLALYAPVYGRAAPGLATTRVDVIEPVRRRGSPGPSRPPTPDPPPGFALSGREESDGFTRISYRSPAPQPLTQAVIEHLSPPQPPWGPVVLVRRSSD